MKLIALSTQLLFIIACNEGSVQTKNPEKAKDSIAIDTISSIVEVKDTVSKNPITDENVREKLLEFGRNNPETVVDIYTTKGKIRARLYKDTPLHRANFIMYTKAGYFENAVFTRIHRNFIAQTGGTYDQEKADIRGAMGNYTVPAEITSNHFHKEGALGAARSYEDNPEKRSHPTEFYFIEGNKFNEITLDKYERDNNYKFSTTQRNYYLNHPGSAHLDGQHTVFGEIISGMDVVHQLTSVAVSSSDRPYKDLYIDSVLIIN